jgi:hypothetical protein
MRTGLDALDGLMRGIGTRHRAATDALSTVTPGFTGWMLGLIAGLTLVKLLLYVAAAQPFGGVHALCQWDCEWYVHTIKDWYDPEPRLQPATDLANWAFFPLFPLLGRILRAVTGLSAFWSGTAVAILCFAGFAALSSRYRALTRPQARPVPWIVTLIVYPSSFYFFMVYTESLYLLLTVLLLLSVRTRDFTGACVATGLATATRPTGVIAIPYLLVEGAWRARTAFRRELDLATRTRILADIAFPLALAPLGLICYMAYLYWLTGDTLAFSHVQVAWSRILLNPLKMLYWSLLKNDWNLLLDPEAPQSKAYAASFAVVAGLSCLWLLWRGLFLEMWLLGATVLLALTTSVDSIPRYVTANPVFLLVVGDLVDRVGSRPARIGLAVASILLQGFLLRLWFARSSALM